MTVYKSVTLLNLQLREQVKEAFKKRYISAEVMQQILKEHPVDLYTPNGFIKAGLAVFTLFISLCTIGLFALFLNIGHSASFFFIIMGVVSYLILELMTGQKKHYNSGVDNMLMAVAVLFISIGFGINSTGHSLVLFLSFIVFIACVWLAIRFADRLAAITAMPAFLSFILYAYVNATAFALATFPFLLIIVSGAIYYFSNRLADINTSGVYAPVFKSIAAVSVLTIYFSGNYYIVEKIRNDLMQQHSAISYSYFFWIWTICVPVVLLIKGFIDKNIFFVRTGLVLIAVAAVTFRYYYKIMATETAMLAAGSVLLATAYFCMRYFRSSKHGFVFDDKNDEESDKQNAEGFIIGQTFSTHNSPEQQTKFGGGSFGGAGAGSDY